MNNDPRFLSTDEIVTIHDELIVRYGGSFGIRDHGLLESAIHQAQASFNGEYLHTTICEMAASYMFHIIQNHPFVDGNKRTGVMSTIVFLKINGHELKNVQNIGNKNLLYELAIKTATSKTTIKTISRFLKKYSY